MIYFACDYAEGTHESILQRFLETNRESTPGYGDDRFSVSAKKKSGWPAEILPRMYTCWPAVPRPMRW